MSIEMFDLTNFNWNIDKAHENNDFIKDSFSDKTIDSLSDEGKVKKNPRRVKSKKFYKVGSNKNKNFTFWDTNIKIK